MITLPQWKSRSAAFMAMAITTTAVMPIISFAPAHAQYNINQSRTVTIPANSNVSFPVTYDKDKIVVNRGETLDLTLKISNDITDSSRNILIPRNTEVVGRLEPVYFDNRNTNKENIRGVRFVSRELVFPSGRRQPINASSQIVTRTEKISKNDSSKILRDAAIGAGATSAISLITGNRSIEVLEPVAGAAAGALASVLLRKQEVEVFVLRPEDDLRLVLNSNLVLDRY
ncbi:conjugal transfer protein TrbI [Nodularia harveyana UHCC-0300]|uniref:Conjugal transfer protein TrbI n=1 Tax=Nodularia harveyana UHCC-0300 TaxID=2974287 RepID=A0ABU5UEE9_9CYAN|nr:conjugal transfer protein TrbI [Nodularia harveyana]MEA5581906.1 conjugal transfer protein TrbI [Nodularia harveyana UHCC-0300]